MTVSSDPITPDEEAHREAMAAQDAHYEAELVQLEADVLEALAERDAALAELAAAREELDALRKRLAWSAEARGAEAAGRRKGLIPRSRYQ